MTEFIQFAVLGLGTGAVYALLGSGMVVIYRGSGVVNFAHGAFAMVSAYLFAELTSDGVSVWLALVAAAAAGAILGLLTQLLIMQRLSKASPIIRIIATLGLLVSLQSAATLHYEDSVTIVPQFLPQHTWVISGVAVESDRLILVGIALAIAIVLTVVMRRTAFGLATSGLAQSEQAVASLGWSPNRLASANWALGGALAGLAGALVLPLTGASVLTLTLLIIPAMAAALLGGFASFLGAFAGALGIGIAQSLALVYINQQGVPDAVPLLVIFLVLVLSGRSLPLRSHITDRLPRVGAGGVRVIPVVVVTFALLALMLAVFNGTWQEAFATTFSVAIVLLSIVILTGYAGQISLAQYAMAGVGAYIAGRLIATQGWPYWAALVVGVLGTVPIAVLFAIPALRTRGVNLALVTLGLGFAIQQVLFNNGAYTGGTTGTVIGPARLLGLRIDITHPGNYAAVTFVVFVVAAVAVANLRRSSAGRRLIAIRENERAASSVGVSVVRTKLYAFVLSALLASLGGILIGYNGTAIVYPNFDALTSIYAIAFAGIGGLGYVLGPVIGAVIAPGGIGTLLNPLFSGINNYLPLIGGVALIIILLAAQDGQARLMMSHAASAGRLLRRIAPPKAGDAVVRLFSLPGFASPSSMPAISDDARDRVAPLPLEIKGLTVRFGGVTALSDVTLAVTPGEVVALIGPNGAGKTTLIDAVTGFVRPASGTVHLGEQEISRLGPAARVRAGVGRSWQSVELFEDLAVFENLQLANDDHGWRRGLGGLIRRRRPALGRAASGAVRELGLLDILPALPTNLSYGERRLVGIARVIALAPSVLLLDEPSSGLSEYEASEMAELIRRLAGEWGMGILLVEHNVELVMGVSDRICVLDFGNVIAMGPPEEIRHDPAVLRAYFGTEEELAAADDRAGATPA